MSTVEVNSFPFFSISLIGYAPLFLLRSLTKQLLQLCTHCPDAKHAMSSLMSSKIFTIAGSRHSAPYAPSCPTLTHTGKPHDHQSESHPESSLHLQRRCHHFQPSQLCRHQTCHCGHPCWGQPRPVGRGEAGCVPDLAGPGRPLRRR